MQLGAVVRPREALPGRVAASMPALVELLSVLAAIAVLMPQFARLAETGSGREQRYAETGFRAEGLPDAVLPDLCGRYGALAEPPVRESLCRSVGAALPSGELSHLPASLGQAVSRTTLAFLTPLKLAEARLEKLRLQQREGAGELSDLADTIGVVEAETLPFVERFQLSPAEMTGPRPLVCATAWARAALDAPAPTRPDAGSGETARVNAVLLLAAALDGRAATEALAAAAVLPRVPPSRSARCPESGVASLAATATLMNGARQSLANSRKNEAMLDVLRTAGWQWAAAMSLGFVFVVWSRRARSAAAGIATALACWAGAAWGARVPWPLSASHGFETGRLDATWASRPAAFVLWLGAAASVLLLWALARPRLRAGAALAPRQAMSSRVGYVGLVLATGLGWLLLLDLSANGHPGNRYLGLYHQGHLWLAMLVFSVLLFLRRPLADGLGWLLSIAGEAAFRATRQLGRAGALLALLLLTSAAVIAFSLTLSNMRQLTSELGRIWLIVGAAWFFFLRASPLTERLARSGPAGLSLLRYVWPLIFVVAVLVTAMLATRDMGPLLIAGYASGAFLAASVAMWWHQRSGQRAMPFVLAVVLFAAWIGATTALLFSLGSVDAVTASRLESVAAPFASVNDQLALVSWFQRAAPADGFGIGAAPWCGFSSHSCSGVPAQIHSDYTFTAIVGVFGAMAAWLVSIATALWLHRLIRHHGRVTRGEPRLLASAGHLANDGQALLSWVAVAWVVLTLCQLAVTVAGNLAVLPLTGVTFPFVSFGMTSLVVNMAFIALCLNVTLPARRSHG